MLPGNVLNMPLFTITRNRWLANQRLVMCANSKHILHTTFVSNKVVCIFKKQGQSTIFFISKELRTSIKLKQSSQAVACLSNCWSCINRWNHSTTLGNIYTLRLVLRIQALSNLFSSNRGLESISVGTIGRDQQKSPPKRFIRLVSGSTAQLLVIGFQIPLQ